MSEENKKDSIGMPTGDQQVDKIVLYDDEGDSVEFEHLDTIELDGKKYVVLTPFVAEEDQQDGEESDVYIMAVVDTETGDNVLEMIDSEEEIERVFQEFKKRTAEDYEFLE